jgi:hypothetical protein
VRITGEQARGDDVDGLVGQFGCGDRRAARGQVREPDVGEVQARELGHAQPLVEVVVHQQPALGGAVGVADRVAGEMRPLAGRQVGQYGVAGGFGAD